jgi:hypothetical protein
LIFLYIELKWLALHKLDFDTGIDNAVFWSGENKTHAYKWALSNGKKTLEMTEGGK